MLPVIEERVRRGARRPHADRQPLAVAQLPDHHQQDLGARATRCWWATPRRPRISPSARAPSWRWKTRSRCSKRSRNEGDSQSRRLTQYDTAQARGGREDPARRQRLARLVRAHEALLGHGAGAVRLRRDVALQADHLGEPRAARPGVRQGGASLVRASKVQEQGFDIDLENPPVPMFTPFRLRDMVVENRVVVSPMDQYSAVDGVPGDWHFVHLGSRAVGGAGPGLRRDDLPVARGAHLAGRHRPVERGAARCLQAHRRFLPRQLEGEDVHAARPLRAARARPSSAGSAWTTRWTRATGRCCRPRRSRTTRGCRRCRAS